MRLYLIRHAETVHNAQYPHIIGGRSNHVELSAKGKMQAKKLGERLLNENYHFSRIYSSPARRTLDTASIALHYAGMSSWTVHTDDSLQELDRGEWTGKIRKEMFTPEVYGAMREDPLNFAAPGGESKKQVEERMLEFVTDEVLRSQEYSVAVFGHGMALKCLFRGLVGSDYGSSHRLSCRNTSISEFEHDEEGWRLVRWNDYSHLTSKD